MGATPETLLSIRQNTLFTMALAGTLPYDSEAKPNWTAKEIEEQQMVVDFISDRLTRLFSHKEITSSATYTKQAGNLVHLCADFQVSLKDFKTIDLIRLLHPTPAVAGLPIDESMAFIQKRTAQTILLRWLFRAYIAKRHSPFCQSTLCQGLI